MKYHPFFLFLMVGVMSLAMVGCATQSRVVVNDQDIANSIKNQLESPSGPDGPFVVDIIVNRGNVTLDGAVPTTIAKEQAMDVAHTTQGVRDVKSFLDVE